MEKAPADTVVFREKEIADGRARKRIPHLGFIFVGVFLFLVVFGYWMAPYDFEHWDLGHTTLPPAWVKGGTMGHILGTDPLGRDVLSRLIHGSRYSLAIAVASIAVYGTIGVVMGLLSGFLGGRADMVIMRLCDLWMSMPAIILAIMLVSIRGPSALTLIIVVGIAGWPGYARIVRGECLSIKQNDYIRLARVAGCGNWRIMFSHILPNLASTLIVMVTLNIGQMIILTATLSFLGLGTQPPSPDWGLMLNEGRPYISSAWWLVVFPAVAILMAVLGFNLVGDWLREILDPKQRLR
jgi:peptide/nickel transport system permease protein